MAEGAPIVVMPSPERLKKPEQPKQRYMGDLPDTSPPPSTEKRGVKGRPGQRPMPEEVVSEGKEDKIKQLRQDHATAVHWSKNEKSPQKREAARQKAEKIKRHLETQYKQGVTEEVEQLDEMPGANMDTRAVHSHLKKRGWKLTRTTGSHDVFTHPEAKHHIPVPRHRQLKAPLVKGILKQAELNEGVEQIDELSNDTLRSYVNKVSNGPSRGTTQTGVLKSIKAIGGTTTAIRKQYEPKQPEQDSNANEDPNAGKFASGPAKKPYQNPTIVSAREQVEVNEQQNLDKDVGASKKSMPFSGPYKKQQYPMTDKSGATHTPMSRAKHIARMAARKQAGMKEEVEPEDSYEKTNTPAKRSLSKTAGMVKDLAKNAKASKKEKPDTFQPEPELSSQIVKV